jgi:hypothetical protein
MEMRFKNETLTMKFRIEELTSNALVKWRVLEGPPEWIGSTIQFAHSANGEETVVLFSHLGWKEIVEYMHHCSTKWGYYMFSLKNLLESGRGTPHPTSSRQAGGANRKERQDANLHNRRISSEGCRSRQGEGGH